MGGTVWLGYKLESDSFWQSLDFCSFQQLEALNSIERETIEYWILSRICTSGSERPVSTSELRNCRPLLILRSDSIYPTTLCQKKVTVSVWWFYIMILFGWFGPILSILSISFHSINDLGHIILLRRIYTGWTTVLLQVWQTIEVAVWTEAGRSW